MMKKAIIFVCMIVGLLLTYGHVDACSGIENKSVMKLRISATQLFISDNQILVEFNPGLFEDVEYVGSDAMGLYAISPFARCFNGHFIDTCYCGGCVSSGCVYGCKH